jgi:transcription antitermination factor NusG
MRAFAAPGSRSSPPRSGPGSARGGKQTRCSAPTSLPGWVHQWRILERTIGVLSVVKTAGLPAKCPDEEIATLIARSDADGIIRLSSSLTAQSVVRRAYEPGAKVWVIDGPFRGFNGLHTGMSTRDREMVLINILGATRPVEIPAGLIASQ